MWAYRGEEVEIDVPPPGPLAHLPRPSWARLQRGWDNPAVGGQARGRTDIGRFGRHPTRARRTRLLTIVLGVTLAAMVVLQVVSPWSGSPRSQVTSGPFASAVAPNHSNVQGTSGQARSHEMPTARTVQRSASPVATSSGSPTGDVGIDCEAPSRGRERAQELLAGRLILPPFKAVRMPRDPTWTENPLRDRHWEFQYHSLRFVWDLVDDWRTTHDGRERDLALFLVRDWVRDNPPARGKSPFAWNDHATAQRALVLACLAETFPDEAWTREALTTHGRVLADPAFYVRYGNHALNQDRGLLAAGCFLRRADWIRLATDRLRSLVRESVDDQGVTNEQAVFYEGYNYHEYSAAAGRLRDCGVKAPPDLKRIDRMPNFLAHATLPNGTYAVLGDTNRNAAPALEGTTAEFAATRGKRRPETGFDLCPL